MITHHLRHQQAGASLGAQAQIHKRHGEGRVVTGIDQIAMEQQRGANAYRRATNSGNDGFGVGGNATQKLEHRRFFLRRGFALEKVADVIASTEYRYIALDDGDADRGVALGLLQRVGHSPVHGLGERVFLVRAVDGEGHHAVSGVGQNVLHLGGSF